VSGNHPGEEGRFIISGYIFRIPKIFFSVIFVEMYLYDIDEHHNFQEPIIIPGVKGGRDGDSGPVHG